MLFLHSYLWFVAASFAFVLAILTPHWVTVQTKIDNVRVQRGVFYSCDFIGKTNFAEATNCTSLLEQRRSIDSNKWTYEYAIACASIAIACAGLSIIFIWVSGIFFHLSQRRKSLLSCLCCLSLINFTTFAASIVVWVLIIVEAAKLGQNLSRENFQWPMWLAVGSTGGYLISLVTLLFSICSSIRRRKIIQENYYRHGEHF